VTTVHVHSFWLPEHRALLDGVSGALSIEELARGARFKVEGARDEFVVSRRLLRRTLSGYLGRPAERLTLAEGPHGKPRLDAPDGDGIEFNLSHSHGRLLIAVCRESPVGIDIERIDRKVDPISLTETALSTDDQERLRAAAAADRHSLFFSLWTRREAALKAVGTGFGVPTGELSGLEIRDLPIDPDFKAAVAVVGGGMEVEVHEADLDDGWH
jgi:4'-phosphopantetheinyl transferase